MVASLTAYLVTTLCHLLATVHGLPASSPPPLLLTVSGNITLPTNITNLNAPPPPNFYIDGTSLYLPHKYRISFEHYGPPASLPAAEICLERAATEYHRHLSGTLMGVPQRTYSYDGVVLGIKPNPRLTWGYWGAAIRAIDSMWKSWDVIEFEFVIGVQEEGILGRGFLRSVDNER